MKEKFASYYKKLKCFQDPVDNPENEGKQNTCEGWIYLEQNFEENLTTFRLDI